MAEAVPSPAAADGGGPRSSRAGRTASSRPTGFPGPSSRGPAAAGREAWLEAASFDAAATIALVAVPLAMGGRHPFGHMLLTLAAMCAAASWMLRTVREGGCVWRFGLVDMLVLAGLAIGFVQIVPLPGRWVHAISPRLATLLPCLDGGPGSLATWNRLSLVPGETLVGLGILLAQGVFLAVLAQRMLTVRDVERVLCVVVGSTALLAALGVVQYLAGNGRYLWFYEFAYNDAGGVVKGTFTNRNHFANFVAAGSGAVIWWVLARRGTPGQPRRPPAVGGPRQPGADAWRLLGGGLLLAAVGFATLSSLSRGGSLSLGVAVVVSLGLLLRSKPPRPAILAGIVGVVVLVLVALQIHGWDRLAERFDGPLAETAADAPGRVAVWRAAWRAIGDYPWLGTGVGSHADISQRYMPPTGQVVFTHAENSYLNVGVETGVVGLVVALAALLIGLGACVLVALRGDDRERAVAAALTAGVAVGAVHAVVDFVWYVPACSTLLTTLGTCGLVLAGPKLRWLPTVSLRIDRMSGLIAGVGVFVLLGGIGAKQLAAARAQASWEEAIKETRRMSVVAGKRAAGTGAAAGGGGIGVVEPAAADGEGAAEAQYGDSPQAAMQELLSGYDRLIAALERTVALRPDHPRGWAELAVARLDRFGLTRRLENRAIGVVDLRQAAGGGRFRSRAEIRGWVRRAAGPAVTDLELALEDAREAVRVAPLSGDAWCVLGQLAFLEGGEPALAGTCVAQALAVRPTSATVIFEAANQALLDGDVARAMELWRSSFAADPRQRVRIISILLPRVSAADACELLEPDLDGLRAIDAAWTPRESADQLAPVRGRRLEAVLARAAECPGGKRCKLLQEAAGLQVRLGQPAAARRSLEQAAVADPSSYEAHLALADLAITMRDGETARAELHWCLLRRPDSQALRERMEKLAKLESIREAQQQPRADLPDGSLQKL